MSRPFLYSRGLAWFLAYSRRSIVERILEHIAYFQASMPLHLLRFGLGGLGKAF